MGRASERAAAAAAHHRDARTHARTHADPHKRTHAHTSAHRHTRTQTSTHSAVRTHVFSYTYVEQEKSNSCICSRTSILTRINLLTYDGVHSLAMLKSFPQLNRRFAHVYRHLRHSLLVTANCSPECKHIFGSFISIYSALAVQGPQYRARLHSPCLYSFYVWLKDTARLQPKSVPRVLTGY